MRDTTRGTGEKHLDWSSDSQVSTNTGKVGMVGIYQGLIACRDRRPTKNHRVGGIPKFCILTSAGNY